ncbi:MAG: ankyrin repeat domain-containing protein [Verrucomicrobiota bacterium]
MPKLSPEERIARGRTDLIVELLDDSAWRERMTNGSASIINWLCFYGDVTALKLVEEREPDLRSLGLKLNDELWGCSFFGHWRTVDFLLARGAEVNSKIPGCEETALHCALCKPGSDYYLHTVRLLLDHGADPNACTVPGQSTASFMRDVRVYGETPLHRAAAFGTAEMIQLLLDKGADREAKDCRGDSPLSWASWHCRPGEILEMLQFGEHKIGPAAQKVIRSDHGAGWGNGMENEFIGEYLPESVS